MLDSLAHLVWREPLWLWLALCPWLLWILQGFLGRPRGRNYADSCLMPWARTDVVRRLALRRFWRHAVLALAWLLFAMAMAGPRIAKTVYEDDQRDTQLMVVLDVSRSMTARDVAPSRLERAKLELEDLIARAERLKIGLVVYAAKPHLMTPLTHDKSVLRHDLEVLRYGLLPTEGSNLPGAIEFAAKHFTSDQAARVVLLVTDGEIPAENPTAESRLADSASLLARQGVKVYALGVGTPGGAPLQSAEGGWLSYRDKAVVSRLHEDRLQKLTGLGNGRYAAVSDTDAEWRKLYDQNIRYLHAADTRDGKDLTVWNELYAWCLIPAALLLLLAYVEPRHGPAKTAVIVWLVMFVVSGPLYTAPAYASSKSWQKRAYQAYSHHSYLEAKQAYARVAGYVGRMGEGSSAYRLGEFQEAVQLFTQAILDAGNDAQRARAVFNLANSRYQLEDYDAAAALYREALRYTPNDKAAQLNLEFAIAMLKQQSRGGGSGGEGKSGRGPRSTHAKDTDLVNGNISLGDKDDAKPPPVLRAGIQPSSGPTPLEQSRPAIAQATEFKDPAWKYANTTPQRIVLQANSLKVDESVLWKRIFEEEEGFAAPVETPRELPDMPPW